MAGFFVIGADLSGILLWETSFKKIYYEWVDIAAMFSVDVPGDLWIDQISATGIPSSRVVLGRMERTESAFLGSLEFRKICGHR